MSNLISKTIPLPTRKKSSTVYNRLPFDKLQVGDSMMLKDITGKNSCGYVNAYNTVRNAVNRNIVARGIGGTFRIGVHNTKNRKQIRIWRIK